MQLRVNVRPKQIGEQMIDTLAVERGSAPYDAVHFVSLLEQEFGKVGTVLACNTRDESLLSLHAI